MRTLIAGLALEMLIVLGLMVFTAYLFNLAPRRLRLPRTIFGKLAEMWLWWQLWWQTPGSKLTMSIATGAVIALAAGIYGQFQGVESHLREWSVELISVSFAVLVIDFANRHRAAIEFKASVIRQMASHSNDFALDAVRIVRQNDWQVDGSLKNAKLWGANLRDADLLAVYMRGAHLTKANLQGADLRAAILLDATLMVTNLQGADLTDANLQGAKLHYANLQGANLTDVNLQDANLNRAILLDATLKGTNLRGANLEGAIYNEKTEWPDGFQPTCATNWDSLTEEERDRIKEEFGKLPYLRE